MGATGQIESFEIKQENLVVPEDMEINLWTGGKVCTEAQQNQGGSTPKVAFRSGCITGITSRTAEVGDIKKFVSILQESISAPVDVIVKLANGEKWSAPVFGVWDDQGFFNSGDGKMSFSVYAIDGYFNQVP